MKKSTLCKFSIACAVCCGVLCGVSVSPLIFALLLALFALLCMLACAIIILVGFFVWLFSVGQANIFGIATEIGNFAGSIFSLVNPVMNFSFQYMTPIVAWIAAAFGVLGIIVSSVGVSKVNKQPPQEEVQGEPIDASANPTATVADGAANQGKKIKKKKKKTEKGVYIATLVVSIVFLILALIAVVVAAKMTGKI